jgi:diguanylate cyclase (GGDEF)-like protein/PAS domain S-box-containing protein
MVRNRTRKEHSERVRPIEGDGTGHAHLMGNLADYRGALNAWADGVVLIDHDTTRIIDVNDSMCRRLGYTRDELIGEEVELLLAEDSTQQVREFHARMSRSDGEFHVVRTQHSRKDGSLMPVEVTHRLVRTDAQAMVVAVARDITEWLQHEEALRRSEARFRALADLSSDWYWEQDESGRFTHFEGRHVALNRSAFDSYLGKRAKETGLEIEHEIQFDTLLRAQAPFRDVHMQRTPKDGKRRYLCISGEPVFDEAGRFSGYRGVGRDITYQKQAEDRIQYLATHDSLTALPNRAMFSRMLNGAIQAARRHDQTFAVLFIDLDRFKIINDTFGHEAGDQLLQEMALRFHGALEDNTRATGAVARLGGDEFVALIHDVENEQDVTFVARKLLSAAIKPMVLRGQEFRITASVGACFYPHDGLDEQALMKNADLAMYLAKDEGRNNLRFYSKEIKAQSIERLTLETSMRNALERNEFFLEYQAKLDLRSGGISGVEALVRWRHPDLGLILPAQFIPLAEETGLIVPIGKWVLETACAQNMAWQRQGLPPMCIAVNLSARQLMHEHLLHDIAQTIADTGMPPHLLELELTESMVVQNPERVIKLLIAIKQMGVRLAIDDFGTGYSALGQLKRFPIDILKVDRSFIRDLDDNAEDRAITEAIIAMGKTLSLTVVAEGVETKEQEDFLRRLACDELQGYYFSEPTAPDAFTELVARHLLVARGGNSHPDLSQAAEG